jgi:hypothetical protein
MSKYLECEFDDTDFIAIPEIGDDFVTSLTIHIEKKELILEIEYRMENEGPRNTALRFTGVCAHHFDHVSDPSIIYGIEGSDVKYIYDIWQHVFYKGKRHHWPIQYDSKEDLIEKLNIQDIKCYKVYGTCGLDGFVLAKGIEYRVKNDPST